MLSRSKLFLSKSTCHNETIPNSVRVIDSILSLDDTLLSSVETNINDDKTHENSLNVLETDWSTCETFETKGTIRNDNEVRVDCCKKLLKNNGDKRDSLDMFCDTFVKEEAQWQDDIFLNEVFTQCNSSNEKKNDAEHSYQDETRQGNSVGCKDLGFVAGEKFCLVNKNQGRLELPKRRADLYNNDVPSKKNYVNDKGVKGQCKNHDIIYSENHTTFYGLPDMVKRLILRVKRIERLYEWQDECLNLDAVKKRKNLIYALPTSGGKTLVAEILMLKELMCNKKNAIFILPFVAIVQEKVQSMVPFALELGFLVEEYAAARGSYPPKKRRKKHSIFICTIEKALGLINSLIEENRLNEIGMIVVDELHLLGENGGRGATLEGLLTKVLYINESIQIIGMSATIGNLDDIAKFLNADLYTGNFRPVKIKEYVKCEDKIWLVDSRSEELLTDLKKINYRYSDDAALIDPDRIGGLVMDVVPNDSCLIFCSSRKNCENVALLLSKVLFRSLENWKIKEKQKLLNALKTEEGLCPVLSKTIKLGVAYHHSGLTSEERRLLEDAFRAGTLCVICCTSTLAAGVNLPARRVILRSPYVGNQFLNISRYKQMIGRAGRAGMGDIGESILICQTKELHKIKVLLRSKMDDSLSTMHIEKDRGINNLILSSTLLHIAQTRSELHKIARKTLLSIQQKQLNIDIKKVADDAITEFLKCGVMKVKKEKDLEISRLNMSVAIPSQDIDFQSTSTEIKGKKTVVLTSETQLELCDLGRAAMKGCMDMQCAYTLYQDLKRAQKHLILVDYLHLLYLVTPYDIVSQVKPVGSVYYDVVTHLSEKQMETARHLGITEVTASKIRDGLTPKNVEARVVQRFYITLMLYELWNHHAVYTIAEKFQVSRGIIQNLLNAVSTFASSVVRFCQELDEFWAFRDLIAGFSQKLSYCCPLELEALMELPLVKIGRARQLYNAGYRTVQSIAKANPEDLQDKISYLGKSAVIQIIEAAKLLILEKVEDLQEETEDILDGVDIKSLRFGTSPVCD